MSLHEVFSNIQARHGDIFAARWLNTNSPTRKTSSPPLTIPPAVPATQTPVFEHDSHQQATRILAPYKQDLGAAYPTFHLLARWSVEHATDSDPAPHLMTCYWSLEEALGVSERTLRRHLIEDHHPWSSTARQLIDVRHNYGSMLDGKDATGALKFRTVITGMVIRFFPKGRQSPNARVKRWGRRDLLADADEGRTRPSRPARTRYRYHRSKGLMSAYRSVKEQTEIFNWIFVKLGQTVSDRHNCKDSGNLYADIPTNHVLNALQADLNMATERAKARGASVRRARTLWVNTAAKLLAQRHQDDHARDVHQRNGYVTHYDGFTDLWRKGLWIAIKSELYGGTQQGWLLMNRMIILASEARQAGKRKPVAWAWQQIKEVMLTLDRDYGSGIAGTYLHT